MPMEQALCITDWKIMHPGWEFMLWNEANSPMDEPYMQCALENKRWANLSNYTRLYALKKYGGIYMDTDFKVIRELTPLLENDCFFGFEEFNSETKVFWLNNAISGAVKDHEFIDKCMNEVLEKYDGNEASNLSSPKLVTDLLISEKRLSEYKDQVLDGIRLYPIEYFYPIHYSEAWKIANYEKYIFPETIAVHMWARSWIDKSVLIETIDHLTQKTNNQHQYITELKELTANLEAKADEIYYWKQHFEAEFNKLNAKQDDFNLINKKLDTVSGKVSATQAGISELTTLLQSLLAIIGQAPAQLTDIRGITDEEHVEAGLESRETVKKNEV